MDVFNSKTPSRGDSNENEETEREVISRREHRVSENVSILSQTTIAYFEESEEIAKDKYNMKTETGVRIFVKNLVCSVNIGLEDLDCDKVADGFFFSYEVNIGPSKEMILLKSKKKGENVKVLIMKNKRGGSVKTMKSSSLEESKDVIEVIIGRLREIGYTECKMDDFSVMCCTCMMNIGFPVDLEKLFCTHKSESCNYEPELFPGVIFKFKDYKMTAMIFKSGKVILTFGRVELKENGEINTQFITDAANKVCEIIKKN